MVETLPIPQFNTLYPDIRHKIEYLVIHYGAKFKSENNEYSPDIAKSRLQYLTSKIISFVKSHKLNTIKVVSLGDMLQGILRLNDLKINDSSVVKATVEIIIIHLLQIIHRFVLWEAKLMKLLMRI